jgi:hypothetical protein
MKFYVRMEDEERKKDETTYEYTSSYTGFEFTRGHIETMHYIKMELRQYDKWKETYSSSCLSSGILISCKRFTGKFLNIGSSL